MSDDLQPMVDAATRALGNLEFVRAQYTPTDEDVLLDYSNARWDSLDSVHEEDAKTEFGLWLAGVKADAWDEGYGDDLTAREPRVNPYRAGDHVNYEPLV